MATTQEKLKEITEKLENGMKEMFDSDRYKQYLATMSKFHGYSLRNIILIYLQKPDASLIAGASTWNRLQRYVNKGEKGISILAPCPYTKIVEKPILDENGNPRRDENGKELKQKEKVLVEYYKPVYVFDVSQTNGKDLELLQPTALQDSVSDYDRIINALKEIAPCPIDFEDIQSTANGYFSPLENRIAIKQGMSESLTARCIIHEIGHAMLHSHEAEGSEKDRQTKEVEAESVSFCVAQYLGIPTEEYSFPYIAGWSSGKEESILKQSLDTIRQCSSNIINELSEKLNIQPNILKSEAKKQTKHI